MKELKINTTGMKCSGCENRMVNALKGIKGVQEVKADHKTGKVEIKCSEEIREEELKEKIETIGFQVK